MTKKTINNEKINIEDYNIVNIDSTLDLYIPYFDNQPIIIEGDCSILIHLNNLYQFSAYLIKSLDKSPECGLESLFENWIELIDFKKNEFNLKVISKDIVKLYNYSEQKELLKYSIIQNDELKYSMNLLNNKTNNPIEIRKYKEGIIYKYYKLNENGKMSLSFNHKTDIPFEVTDNGNIITKDYLIPFLKEKRTLLHKPSFLKYEKKELKDFKYIIDNEDKTEMVKTILDKFNIENPETHKYNNNEINAILDVLEK